MTRHIVIPDTQCEPGVPLEHLDWAAQAIVEYKPDSVIHLGDNWTMAALSSYDRPGSKRMELARIKQDFECGNEGMSRLNTPIQKEINRLIRNKDKQWRPRLVFLDGNHENRVTRALSAEPKFDGLFGLDSMNVEGWERHPFLEIVEIDGVSYSHYFSQTHSGKAIGGSIDNRLNKIGKTFVQGHQQGFLYGTRQYPGKLRRHGLVVGSFYQHDEDYRDLQCNDEWRGIVVLNEVANGDYCVMPLTLEYLRRKYA